MKLVFQMFPGNAAVKMVMADTRKVYGTHASLHEALLQEARELAEHTAHYYDRGYIRREKYRI